MALMDKGLQEAIRVRCLLEYWQDKPQEEDLMVLICWPSLSEEGKDIRWR